MILRAYCATCKETVGVQPILNSSELELALDQNTDIEVMHTPAGGGDHRWSLDQQAKDNLRSAIAKGLL